MTIRLLSAELANQIAAGEVVERPASVVKELVENALDAGATSIQIDIEKGGSQLIRIRDNGCGIVKDELALALSRHATSKIHQLADLERILSLGFRGEALASISSVSRLTLTSKPASQDAAWQAMAEGRDMQVQVRPAAHPDGSTLEVRDLFFNTPARRRFLKSEKTEFSHIEELLQRLALSRFDVAWTLTHNGHIVRQLKVAITAADKQKRLQQLLGRAFAERAIWLDSCYESMQLTGWILPASLCTPQLIAQYSYVNGRMMRDKLLNHAIRQAYGEQFPANVQPGFVLYLTVDPTLVDVNVHPAKHEVRFHEARMVHDFVASALAGVLTDAQQQLDVISRAKIDVPAPSLSSHASSDAAAANASAPWSASHGAMARQPARSRPVYDGHRASYSHVATPSPQPWPVTPHTSTTQATVALHDKSAQPALLFDAEATMLVVQQGQFYKLDTKATLTSVWLACGMASAALMMPQRISVSDTERAALVGLAETFVTLGFDVLVSNQLLVIRAVPQLLKSTRVEQWFSNWLHALSVGECNPVQAVKVLIEGLAAEHLPLVRWCEFFQYELQNSVHWQLLQPVSMVPLAPKGGLE